MEIQVPQICSTGAHVVLIDWTENRLMIVEMYVEKWLIVGETEAIYDATAGWFLLTSIHTLVFPIQYWALWHIDKQSHQSPVAPLLPFLFSKTSCEQHSWFIPRAKLNDRNVVISYFTSHTVSACMSSQPPLVTSLGEVLSYHSRGGAAGFFLGHSSLIHCQPLFHRHRLGLLVLSAQGPLLGSS